MELLRNRSASSCVKAMNMLYFMCTIIKQLATSHPSQAHIKMIQFVANIYSYSYSYRSGVESGDTVTRPCSVDVLINPWILIGVQSMDSDA